MEKQISVIIPTYNMEKYIGKCLDSLLIPELDQVEVLVVNDGSKDSSSEIAHSYADRYPNSIRVVDKTNGNYGSCINTALPIANGRYVKILDADDTFDTAEFSKFVRMLSKLEVDIIFTKCQIVDESGKNKDVTSYAISENRYGYLINDIHSVLNSNLLMHWITYSRNIFNKFNYWQPEGVSYTDNVWAFVPSVFCESGVFLDITLYKYLVGRDGQTVGESQMRKCVDNFIVIANSMIEYYQQFKANKTISNRIFNNTCWIVKYVYNVIFRFKNEENLNKLQKLDNQILSIAPEIYDVIGNYNLHKRIKYKIYAQLRAANFNPNFKIPSHINFVYRNLLRWDAFCRRTKIKK